MVDLGQELQKTASCRVGAGTLTWVLWRSEPATSPASLSIFLTYLSLIKISAIQSFSFPFFDGYNRTAYYSLCSVD